MKRNTVLFALSASLLTAKAIAGTMGPVEQQDWTWVATLSAGPVWGSGGERQTFFLAPGIEKTYTADKPNNTLFNGELFLGLQKALSETVQGQLGMSVAVTNYAKLSGMVWDDANPTFDNFTYRYKIQHTQLALKGKLLADWGYMVIPWISGSAGVAFNRASSFNSTPRIPEALPVPDFTSSSDTGFSYTVGAGVQKAINQHWQVGVGYEFADWGQSRLARAPGQLVNHGLSIDHFYTNGVLFNLTYLA